MILATLLQPHCLNVSWGALRVHWIPLPTLPPGTLTPAVRASLLLSPSRHGPYPYSWPFEEPRFFFFKTGSRLLWLAASFSLDVLSPQKYLVLLSPIFSKSPINLPPHSWTSRVNIVCAWAECPSSVKVKVKSLSRVRLFSTPWTVAYQAPLSLGFSRQEYWSGLPLPSPGDLPDTGIEMERKRQESCLPWSIMMSVTKTSNKYDYYLCLEERGEKEWEGGRSRPKSAFWSHRRWCVDWQLSKELSKMKSCPCEATDYSAWY